MYKAEGYVIWLHIHSYSSFFQQLRKGSVVFIVSSEYDWDKTTTKDH